jgi:hypothetical protein
MPRPRISSASDAPPPAYQTRVVRASLVGGNGTPATDAQRIGHLEHAIETMQQALDIQFRRIAEMQAELDHVKAKQTVSS